VLLLLCRKHIACVCVEKCAVDFVWEAHNVSVENYQ
jgi:hypothetical protein